MALPLLPLLTRGLGGVANTVKTVVGVFRPNAEKSAEREYSLDTADITYRGQALAQSAAEFTGKNNWLDSIVDGLCRLPRPLFAFGAMYLCVIPVIDPVYASQVFISFGLIPAEMYYIIGGIIGFYFGFRSREKRIAGERQIAHTKSVLSHLRKLEALKEPTKGSRPSEKPL